MNVKDVHINGHLELKKNQDVALNVNHLTGTFQEKEELKMNEILKKGLVNYCIVGFIFVMLVSTIDALQNPDPELIWYMIGLFYVLFPVIIIGITALIYKKEVKK